MRSSVTATGGSL